MVHVKFFTLANQYPPLVFIITNIFPFQLINIRTSLLPRKYPTACDSFDFVYFVLWKIEMQQIYQRYFLCFTSYFSNIAMLCDHSREKRNQWPYNLAPINICLFWHISSRISCHHLSIIYIYTRIIYDINGNQASFIFK